MRTGFFISSMPKAGTHLIYALVERANGQAVKTVKEKKGYADVDFGKYSAFPNLGGHYRQSHVRGNNSLRQLFVERKVIVTVRDPRDLCNSMLHYLLKSSNPQHQAAASVIRHLDYEAQIRRIADGFVTPDGAFSVPDIRRWTNGFAELSQEFEDVEVMRYEDFFGDRAVIPVVARVFCISLSDAASLVERTLNGDTTTKRAGGAVAEQWRKYFSPELKQYFVREYADVLDYLGYPAD